MVGLHDLGDFLNQTSAADVNGNDMLTALDAALILRFLVGYDDETAIGEWVLDPATLTLDRHMGPRTGLEAGACLIGDVSGNWSRSDDGMPKRLAARGATVYMRDFESTAVTDGDETLPAYTTVIGLEDSPPGVYAGEITMRVDGARYRLEAIRPRELLGGYTSAGKQTGDQIRIAFAGTEPLAATGELYEVVLTAVDGSGADGTELAEATITRVLHNEYAMSTRVVRRTTGGPKGTPAVATGIERIRSDRFTTDIAFGLAAKMPVRLSVYDVAGREVRTLVDATMGTGMHRVSWDGCDRYGRKVGARMYLLRFTSREYTGVSRLYVLR
jgi:hypothetical protein